MSRRLPVYLLLDTSGSMSGEPIEQVKNGVQTLVSALRQDPYALETAWLSVITFGSSAAVAVPLTELTAFQTPALDARGTTSLGAALKLVSECAGRELTKTTPVIKGDWKPMVFIMTDGVPTDDWKKGFETFRQTKWGIVVGCSMDNGDTAVLKEIAGSVVALNTSDSASIKAFFKWITVSVSASSKSVESAGKEVQGLNELPPPPPEIKVVT